MPQNLPLAAQMSQVDWADGRLGAAFLTFYETPAICNMQGGGHNMMHGHLCTVRAFELVHLCDNAAPGLGAADELLCKFLVHHEVVQARVALVRLVDVV